MLLTKCLWQKCLWQKWYYERTIKIILAKCCWQNASDKMMLDKVCQSHTCKMLSECLKCWYNDAFKILQIIWCWKYVVDKRQLKMATKCCWKIVVKRCWQMMSVKYCSQNDVFLILNISNSGKQLQNTSILLAKCYLQMLLAKYLWNSARKMLLAKFS